MPHHVAQQCVRAFRTRVNGHSFIAAADELHVCPWQGIRDSNHILDEAEDDGLLSAVHEVTTEQLVADKQQVRTV